MTQAFSETYSKLSNDEILNLASDSDNLLQPARDALTAELERRGLSAAEVISYKKYLGEIKPGDWPGKERYVARSFNGFGTAIYGKRDFLQDGSFVTTKWIIFFWIPIVPIGSMRLRTLGPARSSFPIGFSTSYQICSEEKLHWKQALSVYAIMAVAILLLDLSSDGFLSETVSLSLFASLFVVVWLMRRSARARTEKPN